MAAAANPKEQPATKEAKAEGVGSIYKLTKLNTTSIFKCGQMTYLKSMGKGVLDGWVTGCWLTGSQNSNHIQGEICILHEFIVASPSLPSGTPLSNRDEKLIHHQPHEVTAADTG